MTEMSEFPITQEVTRMGFRNPAAEFTYVRTYSRWIEAEKRRETWEETVQRYIDFIVAERGDIIPKKVISKIKSYMLQFDVMPSMRALWAAGDAARADNTCLYNCSFAEMDSVEAFSECLYVLMCGTGFGFSVTQEAVNKLPTVPVFTSDGAGVHVVQDSKVGWADSLKCLMYALYDGKDLGMDYSLVRPQGARLKTMGGRASGPAPLITLHNFVREVFSKAQGRKLTPLEVHDVCNQIAEIVVVGGVRRSSQISLSDLKDEEMKHAKEWPFPLRRAMANNSAIYTSKPTGIEFMREWAALAQSGTGERGIFNLGTARERAPERRDPSLIAGTNPCAEILLRNMEFCNLSEIVVRAGDDLDSLLEKVEAATWIGVIQSTFTYFPYLRPEWKKNCDEERLLGVSLTGQMDAPELLTIDALKAMKSRAIRVAKKASTVMGIPMPKAITCVKPSGTVSQLVDSASGMHPRYSRHYIRRYRIAGTDPLFALARDQGMPYSAENGQRKTDWDKAGQIYGGISDHGKAITEARRVCPMFVPDMKWDESMVTTWVISFPVEAPENCITRNEMSAIDQLEWYKRLQLHWCEHNASLTVYVRDDEWMKVGQWVYENWEIINGVSFLPYDGGKYEQAPYEEITEERYRKVLKSTSWIDYMLLGGYETMDNTNVEKSYACTGDKCELV